MKTFSDIIAYCQSSDDIFGFSSEVLLPYLTGEQMQPFLQAVQDETDMSKWQPTPLDRETILAEMQQYMAFAWEKVEHHRGISAARSIVKMCAWLWLLDDEQTLAFAKNYANYSRYGAPVLKRICEVYGFPIPPRTDVARMAQGKPCQEDCEKGCKA